MLITLLKAKAELQKVRNEAEMNAQNQVIETWKADMQFGNKLSKTISGRNTTSIHEGYDTRTTSISASPL